MGLSVGALIGVLAMTVMLNLSEADLIKECELNLPRTQHCEIIKTAEVVK